MFDNNIEKKLRSLKSYLNKVGLYDEEQTASSLLDESSDLLSLRMGEIRVSKDSEYNSSEEVVTYIQEKLIAAGFELPRFGIDGKFGRETERAVMQFQGSLDPPIEEDGIVDSALLVKLDSALPLAEPAAETTETPAAETTETTAAVEGEVFRVNGDIVYPFRRNAHVNLVVFYHGTTGQDPVLAQVKQLSTTDTMFLIPRGAKKNYSSVLETVNKLSNDYGITINNKKLGGWSAGTTGFLSAINSDNFDTTMLADPAPNRRIMRNTPSGVYMEYNPSNWGGRYIALKRRFPTLVSQIESKGGTTKLMEGVSHEGILASILSQLV